MGQGSTYLRMDLGSWFLVLRGCLVWPSYWVVCKRNMWSNFADPVSISLGDGTDYANTERFLGSEPLLPHLCPLFVR